MEPEGSLPRVQKNPPPVPNLSDSNPIQDTLPPFHCLRTHFNVIVPSTSGSPKWSLSLRIPHQNFVNASPLPTYPHTPRLFSFFSILSQYWVSSTNHKAPHYVVFSTPCYLLPLRSKYSPQHPILNTFSLRSLLNVCNQVSHPYKAADAIIALCTRTLIFIICTANWKTQHSACCSAGSQDKRQLSPLDARSLQSPGDGVE
jgi:hypothetical protein